MMTHTLSDPLLSKLSELIAAQMGMHFPRERWGDLERGLQSAAREFGATDADACAEWLLSAPLTKKQIEVLAGELTIGETYFFRDKRTFEILSEEILPEFMRSRQGAERRLRIWSAGCCTGEEPYSIAISLDRVWPDLRQWHVTILGTDVNPRSLRKAAAGVFSDWSFRESPPWLKDRYFRPVGERRFEILPRIKEKVTFAYLNLAEDVYPSLANNTNAMDLIFCRNVLMYFAAERTKQVVHNFHRALVDNGWLLVNPTETSGEVFAHFSPVHFQGAILYRKGDQQGPAAASGMWRSSEAAVELTPGSVVIGKNFVGETPEGAGETLAPLGGNTLPTPLVQTVIAAQADQANPTAYEEAAALFERGDYAKAAQRLEADAATPAAKADNWALLARIYANLGGLAEARSWAEKAIAHDKLNAGFHYLRAVILQEQGEVEEAISALKRARYLDPNFVLVHFGLGNLALQQQKIEEANKHFAITLDLLAACQSNDILPQSDGLAAGRLKEMVGSAMSMERTA